MDFFNAIEHICKPPPPCTVFVDFCYLGFTIGNSEGKDYMFMCDKGGLGSAGNADSPLRFQKILEL